MRKQGKCPGDCARCDLLSVGEVDMVPCILDQIFQRLQKIEMKFNKEIETNIAQAPE